jgi:hypothetical protein
VRSRQGLNQIFISIALPSKSFTRTPCYAKPNFRRNLGARHLRDAIAAHRAAGNLQLSAVSLVGQRQFSSHPSSTSLTEYEIIRKIIHASLSQRPPNPCRRFCRRSTVSEAFAWSLGIDAQRDAMPVVSKHRLHDLNRPTAASFLFARSIARRAKVRDFKASSISFTIDANSFSVGSGTLGQ